MDVWCDAPVKSLWKEYADSALSEEDRREKWGGVGYWFALGMCVFFGLPCMRLKPCHSRCTSVGLHNIVSMVY